MVMLSRKVRKRDENLQQLGRIHVHALCERTSVGVFFGFLEAICTFLIG